MKPLVTVILVICCYLCYAAPFTIGAYGLYDLGMAGAVENVTAYKNLLVDSKYNTAHIYFHGSDISRLETALSGFGNDIDVIIEDRSWNPNQGSVGVGSLSYGNYLKMEAEYMYKYIDDLDSINDTLFTFVIDDLTSNSDPGDGDVYNYIFAHQDSCGYRLLGAYSNQYAWVCDETLNHIPGLALSNPRFRWKILTHRYPRSIGCDFKFRRSAIIDNRLYLTIAMRFGGDSLAAGEDVASIKLKVLKDIASKYDTEDYTFGGDNYYEFTLHPVNCEADTIIHNKDYQNYGVDMDIHNNLLFEYYIEFPPVGSMLYNFLIKEDNAGDYFLHINPEVYWHGNGKMELDYIIIEDEFHRQLRKDRINSVMYNNLKNRINQILGASATGNVAYFYTKDEPFQAQFQTYGLIEELLEQDYGQYNSPKVITAINPEGYRIHKSDQENADNEYKHYLNFLYQAEPRTIALDAYPFYLGSSTPPEEILWNNDTSELAVQRRLDKFVTRPYRNLANEIRNNVSQSVRSTQIVYIPQVFGEYVTDASDNFVRWKFLKPPRSMIKCLQLLPLCYSADGILDYTLLASSASTDISASEKYHYTAPLMHSSVFVDIHDPNADNDPQTKSSFELLCEANEKIAIYGAVIDGLTWGDADCLMTSGGTENVNISPYLLQDIKVHDPYEMPTGGNTPQPNPPYNGYVQCGYYSDGQLSPNFMLVNRRAVYKLNESAIVTSSVDDFFGNASSQTVQFSPSPSAYSHFGPHIALYDAYDHGLYREDNGNILVPIDAGDGKLLQMCGTLPVMVSGDCSLVRNIVLGGNVELSDSVMVQIQPEATVRILPNTHITLNSGANLEIKGNITIGDGVRFSIAEGACVYLSDAVCEYQGDLFIEGSGSYIVADSTYSSYKQEPDTFISGGVNVVLSGSHIYSSNAHVSVATQSTLTYEHAYLDSLESYVIHATNSNISILNSTFANDSAVGDSLVADGLSSVSVVNSQINDLPIRIENSDLNMDSCILNVGENSSGIIIDNSSASRSVNIVCTQGHSGMIIGNNLSGTKGVEVINSGFAIFIDGIDFSGLMTGIELNTNAAFPDSILDCTFDHCSIGVSETCSGASSIITNSLFDNNEMAINLSGSTPTIRECTFNACETGIFFDGTFYAPKASGVFNSSFNMCNIAIETRAANPSVSNCEFYMNDIGLLCHNDSNANLSYNKGNCFRNLESNIKFYEDNNYYSHIQLVCGHNDFWHFGTPDQSIASLDFHFDDYYTSSNQSSIDVTKNWFEADSIMINLSDNPDYESYVSYEYLDEVPNTSGTDPDGGNRYLVALHLESTRQFELASSLYQTILNEGLESEVGYFNGCVDGLFRSGCLQEMQAEILASYLEQKITQYTPIDSSFCKLLSDYQIKAYVVAEDFQSAINIVQARIDEPVSVIDSLRAVLDLEIILQLESMKGNKKPLAIKYTQYRYPNTKVFHARHEEHLAALYKELDQKDEEIIQIPPLATIATNYPNPFNPSTTISFSVPKDALTTLSVYNIKGQKVKDIVNGELPKGFHKAVWDGKDSTNRSVGSGIYLIRLYSGGSASVRKVALMK